LQQRRSDFGINTSKRILKFSSVLDGSDRMMRGADLELSAMFGR